MSFGRRRRRDLTLADKVEVIRLLDTHTSQTKIAKLFDCSQSQVSRLASKREEILQEWEMSDRPERKRRRTAKAEDAANAMKDWDIEDQEQNTTLVSTVQKDKSQDNSSQLHKNAAAPAGGWINRWQDRALHSRRNSLGEVDSEFSPWIRPYGSTGKRGRGRPRATANMESRISNQLLDVLKNYDLCDVYCADEIGLHFAAMPNLIKTEKSQTEEDNEGGDKSNDENTERLELRKEQITIFLACNVTGSDKRDLLIITDSNLSGCFHGANNSNAVIQGCQRAKSPNAWMTADIFKEWLLAFDHAMRQQRRYVLLLVDNAPPHVPEAAHKLEHVRVLFVRPYATPFFHGLFYHIRVHYRKQVLLKLIAVNPNLTNSTGPPGKKIKSGKGDNSKPKLPSVNITLPEAVAMLQRAWLSISPRDIVPCFSKAGICAPHIHGLPEPKIEALPDLPEGIVTPEQFEDFVNVDADVECTGDRDLLSVECTILSDLKEQTGVDLKVHSNEDHLFENPIDRPTDISMNMIISTTNNTCSAFDGSLPTTANASTALGLSTPAVFDRVGSTEVSGALSMLKRFMHEQGLHLHNLQALESQILNYVGHTQT